MNEFLNSRKQHQQNTHTLRISSIAPYIEPLNGGVFPARLISAEKLSTYVRIGPIASTYNMYVRFNLL